jgi:2',3'-cyclic-nucleotide 2'-phosphodiesterase (5'-nucleotidase family)
MPSCIERPVCAAVLMLLVSACGKRESAPAPVSAPHSLSVIYTCDTKGNVRACECTGGSAGGLARRMTFLDQNRSANRIVVDVGNNAAGSRDWEKKDFEFLMRGYAKMNYDAVNIGHGEAAFSADELRHAAMICTNLISANLLDENGKPVVAPYRIKVMPDGLRVGIIGVMDTRLPEGLRTGAGLRLIAPDEAITKYLPELKKQSDTMVILAYTDEPGLSELANLFFEAGIVIGGKVSQPASKPAVVNRAVVTYITELGKTAGRLDLRIDAQGVSTISNSITTLYSNFPDAPEMKPLLDEYQKALGPRASLPAGVEHDAEGLSPIKSGGKP